MLKKIKSTVEQHLPNATVVIYGSVARGTHGAESDYDVLVLTDTVLSRAEEGEIDDALYELQLAEGKLIVAAYQTRDAWGANPLMPLRRAVDKEGILL